MLSLSKKKSIDFKASSLKVNVDVLFFLYNLFFWSFLKVAQHNNIKQYMSV